MRVKENKGKKKKKGVTGEAKGTPVNESNR